MALITNIRHFLDEDGEVPDLPQEALELLFFLAAIVEAASLAYDRPITFADVDCRTVVDGEPCDGDIEAWVFADDNRIGWECLECGAEGVISDWEETQWDRRNYVVH